MDTTDDDFPYTSDDPSLTQLENGDAFLSLTTQQLDDLRGVLRLAVGSALSGNDALTKRMRKLRTAQELVELDSIVIDVNETSRDRFRFLVLGILFEAPDLIQRFLVSAEQVSGNVYSLFSRIISPFTSSRVFSPAKGQFERAASRGEHVVDRLVMKGRMEERNSRRLVQQKAVDDLVSDLLEYIVERIDIQELIQEEGVDVAGSMVDEFREQSSNVDSLLDSKLRSFFKRVPPKSSTPPTDQTDGSKQP